MLRRARPLQQIPHSNDTCRTVRTSSLHTHLAFYSHRPQAANQSATAAGLTRSSLRLPGSSTRPSSTSAKSTMSHTTRIPTQAKAMKMYTHTPNHKARPHSLSCFTGSIPVFLTSLRYFFLPSLVRRPIYSHKAHSRYIHIRPSRTNRDLLPQR